jgi:hypothetical protein
MKLLPMTLLLAVSCALQAEVALPDLQTVVPQQVQLVNEHQRDIIRFSNAIANTGEGSLQFHPEFPGASEANPIQSAYQDIFNTDGTIAESVLISNFVFHPQHNHWHIAGVALFEVRIANANGSFGDIYGGNSVKNTFCLVDWYKLVGPSKTPNRVYFECDRTAESQGISPGWADQYHQATEGQQLDVTGIPVGLYYLVSTCNYQGTFREKTLANNTAWVKFSIKRDSKGNPKLAIVGTSPTSGPFAEALSGVGAPNR